MKKILLFLLALCQLVCFAQIPKPTGRLVNDYADVLSSKEVTRLESRLHDYYDTTHNTILLIITTDLGGYEIAEYAQRVGDAWNVGAKGKNNGLVMVVKPKNDTYGDVHIATGYGLEGALPDAICHRIAEDYMVPEFRNDHYYDGICAALDVICPIAAKEFSYEDLKRQEEEQERQEMISSAKVFGIFLLIIISLVGFQSYFKKHPTRRMRREAALKRARGAYSTLNLQQALCDAQAVGATDEQLSAARMACWKRALRDIEYARSVPQLNGAMGVARDLGLSEEEIKDARDAASKHALHNISCAGSESAIADAVALAALLGLSVLAIEAARKKAMDALRAQSFTTPTYRRNGGFGGFGGGRTSRGGGSFGGFGGGRFGGGGGGARW